ncbi:MAG: chromosome segregation protein SMC [Vampirovibrio sp.]|nr:chromosome segregation protein SMC [Vampirovibrio sp.]
MYIHQIEIDNFKSFSEKTTIPFRKGFTTISGPNGSGKSNIVDSILFCLGLSTSRTMRAEKLSDLINNLSRRREAMVTITFVKDESALKVKKTKKGDDNPASQTTETDPDNLLTVTRRIKESSNGYNSTYVLNGKTTTLTEIHEELGKHNVSPGCFNVMMQGDVASFVNMSAMERRKIVDEIAGVAEFDRKIDQAQKELDATGANIERNTILLGEIEARMEQLAAEREHALKYQKLRDERQQFEGQLLSAKYLDIQKAVENTRQNLSDAKQKKETTAKEIETLAATVEETRAELIKLSEEVKKKGEDQQIALFKQIESLKGHISRKEDAIAFVAKQTTENLESVTRMEADIERQKQNIEDLDGEMATFQHQLKELQGLYDAEAKSYEKLNAQFDQMTESTGELSTKRSEVRQKLDEAENKLSSLNRDLMDQENEKKRLEFERDLYLQQKSSSDERSKSLADKNAELSTSFQEADLERAAFEAQLNKLQKEYSQLRVDTNTAVSKYNDLSRDYDRLDARKRAYEDLSFARPVEMILSSGVQGIHGTLAQLGQVDGNYGLAMEVAMGGRVQNVVVDDERVAEKAIQYLQQNRGGRATFLPLTKMRRSLGLSDLPKDAGVVDYAINLIDFLPKYKDIFAYALGDTLIVKDMAAARKLLRQYRMVTMDGSLLEKTGAMSGGSTPGGKNQGRFFNGANVEEELNALRTQLDDAEINKEKLQKQLTAMELKLSGVKEDYAQCMNRHARLTVELESIEQQLAEIRKQSTLSTETLSDEKEMKKQISAVEKTIKSLATEKGTQEKTVHTIQAELEAIDNKLPADQLNALRKEMNEVKFQMDYYDSQIRNVQADIKSKEMEKSYQEVGIQNFTERITACHTQNKEAEKEKAAHQEEIDLTLVQIKDLEAQTSELGEELKKLQEERDAAQAKLIEEEKNKNVLERQISQIEEQIVSFQARLRELNEPLLETATELRQAGIDPDTLKADDLPSEENIQQNIQRLTKRMEALEPVNMLAIQEYDEVNGRKTELADKIDTLNRECDAIQVKMSGYFELKLLSFRKAFDHVDNSFKTIFADLSDGAGQLVLTNPDDPFSGGMLIEAQPRGKKMLRIEAMSGGEKSLTSLAFVFALQRYQPAPFYALDEVDMNLDGINVEKLARMLLGECKKGAQFVVVSLRKPMIEHSDRTIGVTQKRNGTTRVTGIKIRGESDDHDPSELEKTPLKEEEKVHAKQAAS